MPVPEGVGSGESPSLFASLRSFWSVVVAILYTRLDLVSAELEDEAVRGLKLVLAGLISAMSLMFAVFFAFFFIIALAWDSPYRFPVIGGIFAIYLLIGVVLAFIARNMIMTRPRFLSQSIAELKRDAEGLSKAMAPKTTEVPK
jgi:uncharacterized membrane protein YqjE